MELFDFQKENVLDAKNKGGRVIFADKSGLGKRAQSIGLLNEKRSENVVVITSSPIKNVWFNTILNFSEHLSKNDIHITSNSLDVLKQGCNIVSFEYALKNENKIREFLKNDSTLIVDNNRRFKKEENKITRCIYNISCDVKYLSLLINLGDYFTSSSFKNILYFLNPNGNFTYLDKELNSKEMNSFVSYLNQNVMVKSRK